MRLRSLFLAAVLGYAAFAPLAACSATNDDGLAVPDAEPDVLTGVTYEASLHPFYDGGTKHDGAKDAADDGTTVDATTPKDTGSDATSLPDALAEAASDTSLPDAPGEAAPPDAPISDAANEANDANDANDGSVDAASDVHGGGCSACAPSELCCDDACVPNDESNCGACNLACPTGCTAGECVVTLASGQDQASCVAVDGSYVYWGTADFDTQTSALVRAPKDGSGSPTVLVAAANYPFSLVLDTTSLYWAADGAGAIETSLLSGASVTTLFSGQSLPRNLVRNGPNLFWVTATDPGTVDLGATSGGSVVSLASSVDGPHFVVADGNDAYWLSGSETANATLMHIDLTTSVTTTLATGFVYPGGAAIDATYVYVAESGGEDVLRVARADGTTSTVASNQASPGPIVFDGTNLYWLDMQPTSAGPSAVVKYATDTGVVSTLVADLANPVAIAVDETSVYWVTGDNPGTVAKVTPK